MGNKYFTAGIFKIGSLRYGNKIFHHQSVLLACYYYAMRYGKRDTRGSEKCHGRNISDSLININGDDSIEVYYSISK